MVARRWVLLVRDRGDQAAMGIPDTCIRKGDWMNPAHGCSHAYQLPHNGSILKQERVSYSEGVDKKSQKVETSRVLPKLSIGTASIAGKRRLFLLELPSGHAGSLDAGFGESSPRLGRTFQ